jgi:hypothetical protein
MKRDAFDRMMMVEMAIMLVLFALIIIFSGCSGLHKVAPPLQGGKADLVVSGKSPGIKVVQPKNAQAPTLAEYSREMVPMLALRTNLLTESSNMFGPSVFDTNWVVVRETYKTSIGEHQKDVAREGWVSVQQIAARAKAISPVMYFGLALIGLGFLMGFLRYKLPAVFNFPGTYILYLIFFGLFLSVLPHVLENKAVITTICLSGIVSLIIFGVYAYSKNKTTTNKETKK